MLLCYIHEIHQHQMQRLGHEFYISCVCKHVTNMHVSVVKKCDR